MEICLPCCSCDISNSLVLNQSFFHATVPTSVSTTPLYFCKYHAIAAHGHQGNCGCLAPDCGIVCKQKDLIPLLRELGIGIVTYSPLGRGFLTGSIADLADLSPDDRRRYPAAPCLAACVYHNFPCCLTRNKTLKTASLYFARRT